MFVTFKKTYIFITILLIAAAVTLPTLTVLAINASEKPVIVIDPGHGGYDGGVIGIKSGVKESIVNLEMAKLVKGYFESDGYKVVLTRQSDKALASITKKQKDMQERVRIVNSHSPKLLISLHVNYYPATTRRGIQVFYTKNNDKVLAETLQRHLNATMNSPTINKNFDALYADYYILANSNCPAALIECGFFSNSEDEKLLLDENYRMLLAYQIFEAVKTSFSSSSSENQRQGDVNKRY